MDDPRLVPDVEKIAVLRPNGIGDFVFSLPALHALKAAYPQAKLIYIGKQWHADFLHGRPGPIDEVAVMPPYPGVEAPPDADPAPAQSFIDALRAARFDLAVQIYGGGRYSNPLVKRFEARITIGIKAADAEPLDRWVSFSRLHNNRLLMLEVAALAGANRLRLGRELEVTDRDRQEAASVIPADQFRPLVLIHAGAGDPRRHWPAERFAAVADALFEAGALIAMNGTAIEGPEVRRVIDAMRHPALDLSDRLSIAGLCGVLERCALVVSNDSGPLHLALAVGAPAVGIYWLTNLYDGGPLVQDRHRAAMSSRTHCPVCGAENLKSRCPHDVSFVDDVTVDEVLAMSMELLHDSRRRWPDVPSGE